MSYDTHDVVVVGGRCAGSPLAMLLARAGLKVCLVDRASFPSDTPSTHAIQPSGVRILERLGLREPLERVAAQIEGGRVRFDDVQLELGSVREILGAPMLNARRVTLDAILLDEAAAAGVDVRPGTAVTGLLEDGGRVAGVRTAGGDVRARLVVGADGARSTVARLVGAPEYHQTAPGRVFLWAYFEGACADDGMWLGQIGEHAFLASPTDEDLFMAAVVPSIERRDEVRGDRDRAHAAGLRHWPELHACLEGARRVGPVQMMARWHGFFRRSAGPGWVLVGDAGHFKDPTPGQGISDALRQVVELAPAIERALDGAGDRALEDWWAWRDRDAWEMYWFAHDMGAPGATPPVIREIQRRMAGDRALTIDLLRILNHDVPPSEVFTPALAARAIAKALAVNRGRRGEVLREVRALARAELRRRGGPRQPAVTARSKATPPPLVAR